ncbi:MAG TPA: hypothetical protein VF136_06150, partial [Methylomirabilota bacterium]
MMRVRLTPSQRRAALVLSGGLFLLATVLLFGLRHGRPAAQELAFSEFLTEAHEGRLASIDIRPDAVHAIRRDGQRIRSVLPPGFLVGNETFVTGLMQQG